MSRELKVVERHLRHWRAAGLVSPEQEDALRRASGELEHDRAGSGLRAAVALLGGGLLLAGLVLIVAENWEAIPRLAKLAAWAVLQGAFLAGTHAAGRRFPERAYLAEALALVSGGWVLGGIALVSQIYHLDARPPNGIWFWAALVVPAAYVLQRRAVTAVVFVAVATGLTLELGTRSWIGASNTESPWLWLAVPLAAAFLASWLPQRLPGLRNWVGASTFGVSQFFLLVFGATGDLDESGLGRAWSLAAFGLLAALAFPRRVLPDAWGAAASRALLALSLAPWIVMGRSFDQGATLDLLAQGLSWVVQLAAALVVIRCGASSGSRVWVNLGYLAVLAGVVTRYFDFFGAYLEGGLALVFTGTLLLFVVYALERARRRTLAREAP